MVSNPLSAIPHLCWMQSLVHVSDGLIVNQLNGVSVSCQNFPNLLCALNRSGMLRDQQLGFKFAHQVDCFDPKQSISRNVTNVSKSQAIAIFIIFSLLRECFRAFFQPVSPK